MSESESTELGTPCSPRWTRDWVSKVEGVEGQMGRRICGAHSPAWTPCKLSSTHVNGRCRFHGGAEGIGAPNGNRNALIHGLYSRRLQRCGMQCPVWQHCPMAGKDVLALDPTERPNCVYEEQEYNALTFSLGKEKVSKKKPLSDEGGVAQNAEAASDMAPSAAKAAHGAQHFSSDSDDGDDPEDRREQEYTGSGAAVSFGSTFSFSKEKVEGAGEALLHQNVAMYQVMLTRARAALGVARLVEDTVAEGEHYSMKSSKVSALLQAELRIGRELRQWLRLLGNDALRFALGLGPSRPEAPEEELSLPDEMASILAKTEGVLEASLVPRRLVPGPSPV